MLVFKGLYGNPEIYADYWYKGDHHLFVMYTKNGEELVCAFNDMTKTAEELIANGSIQSSILTALAKEYLSTNDSQQE